MGASRAHAAGAHLDPLHVEPDLDRRVAAHLDQVRLQVSRLHAEGAWLDAQGMWPDAAGCRLGGAGCRLRAWISAKSSSASPISRLHLAYISPISRLDLGEVLIGLLEVPRHRVLLHLGQRVGRARLEVLEDRLDLVRGGAGTAASGQWSVVSGQRSGFGCGSGSG